MNTVNRSKCRVATSQNWIGSTTKKARIRLRWSPRRVGDRVMNSRSAKNAISANSRVATVSPAAQAIQNTTTMNQRGAQQIAEVLQLRVPGLVVRRWPLAKRQQEGGDADDDQQAEHDDEQGRDLLGGREVAQELVHAQTSRSAITACARPVKEGAALFARARARSACRR